MNNRSYTLMVRSAIEKAVSPLGYCNVGQGIFVKREPELVKVIQVHKGKYSTKEMAELTVGLGIMLIPLARALGRYQERPPAAPPICQWTIGIGDAIPERRDIWWEIDSPAKAEETSREIVNTLLKYGIPLMDSLGSREALRKLWESGKDTWISEFERKQYLETLKTLK